MSEQDKSRQHEHLRQQGADSAPPAYRRDADGVDGAPNDSGRADPNHTGSDYSDPWAAFENLARAWPSDAVENLAKAFGAMGGAGTDREPAFTLDGDAGRAAMLMLKGYSIWTQQGIRYWSQLAELHGTYVHTLIERARRMHDDPHTKDAERNALIDEAQRYLREVADVSMREGRVLRQELERLSGELRTEFGQSDEAGAPKRYVKAKT